jgi:hypothetical protein
MTNAVTIAQGGSAGSITGYRNRLINGGMDVWQRGTSFSAPGAIYMADRWKCGYQDDGAVYTQQTSDLAGFNYYIRMIKGGTANGSHMIQQAIETQNTPDMIGQWATFSCYARLSNATTQATHQLNMALGFSATTDYSGWLNSADICSYYANWRSATGMGVVFQAGSTTTSPSTPVKNDISLTTSWQRFYYTLLVPANTKTIVCGVYSEATLQNGGIDVTGIQFEAGTSPSTFERRHIQQEFAMCQRYYQRHYDPMMRGVMGSTTSVNRMGMVLPVQMRTSPGVSMSGTFNMYDGAGTGTVTGLSALYSTPNGIEWDASLASGSLGAQRPAVIYTSSQGGSIIASAEI